MRRLIKWTLEGRMPDDAMPVGQGLDLVPIQDAGGLCLEAAFCPVEVPGVVNR
jgi:hypothetical protein